MSNQILLLLCKSQRQVLLIIMYIVSASRNLQQDEVGAVQVWFLR